MKHWQLNIQVSKWECKHFWFSLKIILSKIYTHWFWWVQITTITSWCGQNQLWCSLTCSDQRFTPTSFWLKHTRREEVLNKLGWVLQVFWHAHRSIFFYVFTLPSSGGFDILRGWKINKYCINHSVSTLICMMYSFSSSAQPVAHTADARALICRVLGENCLSKKLFELDHTIK